VAETRGDVFKAAVEEAYQNCEVYCYEELDYEQVGEGSDVVQGEFVADRAYGIKEAGQKDVSRVP